MLNLTWERYHYELKVQELHRTPSPWQSLGVDTAAISDSVELTQSVTEGRAKSAGRLETTSTPLFGAAPRRRYRCDENGNGSIVDS